MATRSEVNQLAARSFYVLLRKSYTYSPYIFSLALRSIVHRAKQDGTQAVAKEMIKEIYQTLENKDPQNSREFLWWFRTYVGMSDDLFNAGIEDASEATRPVDVS